MALDPLTWFHNAVLELFVYILYALLIGSLIGLAYEAVKYFRIRKAKQVSEQRTLDTIIQKTP